MGKVGFKFFDIAYDDLNSSLAPFMDDKSIVTLSNCSHKLYQTTSQINYWREKLVALGFNKEMINHLATKKIIFNYKNLYRTLICIERYLRNSLKMWEFCCLSGEVSAIDYAIQTEELTGATKGVRGTNALLYTSLSGSLMATKHVYEKLTPEPLSTDMLGRNALHFSGRRGSVIVMDFAVKILKIDPVSTDLKGRNVLHYAESSASSAAKDYVVKDLGILHPTNEDTRHCKIEECFIM